jgi:hypothetical protein
MRSGRLAAAFGLAALVCRAEAQTSPSLSAVEPLIECRVTGDAAKRVLSVDIAWPSGLKPRFPRDDSEILSNRTIAPVDASKASPARIDDTPEWANTCGRDGCRLAYSVDIARGIATDKRGDWGF